MAETNDDEIPTFLYRAQCGALGLTFYGTVDDNTAAAFEDALQYVEQRTAPGTVVPLFISSTGGDVYGAMKIIDLLQSSELDIQTVAIGACMSAAALIFSFGSRRFVGENATIMLHGVRVESFEGKLKDVEVEASEMRRLNTRLWSMMSTNCGRDAGHLQEHFKNDTDYYVTPRQAIDLGFATDIGVPRLRANVCLEVVKKKTSTSHQQEDA